MKRKLTLKLKLEKPVVAKWLWRQQMEGYKTGFVWFVTNKAEAASSRNYLSQFKFSCLKWAANGKPQ